MMLGSTIIESPLKIIRSTTPEQLGLQGYNEIRRIYIGDCGANDDHYGTFGISSFLGGAHTHACPYDPIYNSICVSDINELLDDIGTPSSLFMHEYAHVITKFPQIYLDYNWRCVGPNSLHAYDIPAGENLPPWDSHGKEWEESMRKLGQKPTLYATASKMSKYAQAAAVIK